MDFMKERKPAAKPAPPPAVAEYDLAPAKSKVAEYLAQLKEIQQAAEKFIVSDEATLQEVVELGSKSAKLVKGLDADRKQRIDKQNTFVRAVNTLYKPLTDIGKEIKRICGQKHAQYQAKVRIEEQKRQKAAEEAQKKLQAKLDAEAKEAKVEPVEVAPVEIAKAPAVTRAESGSAHTRKEWTWKEVDFSKIPDGYKMLNNVAINKAVRAGIRTIEGVEIFQKETTQFRT